jgi:hypothetical protein
MPEPNSEHQSEAPAPVDAVTPLSTLAQLDTHKANVAVAAATQQNAIQTALGTWKAGGTVAAMATSIKNADIAYHQAIVSSAVANGLPYPTASLAVLRGYGV